jgi:hypothetical protein
MISKKQRSTKYGIGHKYNDTWEKESNSYRLQGSLKEDSHRDREMSSSLVENESSHIGEDTPLAAGSLAEDIHDSRGTGTHGHRHNLA